jgi:hypothetical protein
MIAFGASHSMGTLSRQMRALVITAVVAAVVFLVGLVLDPARAWGGYLMGFTYFTGLALAGPLFVAIVHLTGARWGYPLRRVPEAMGTALPVALLLGLVLVTGIHSLYEWSHSQVVESDALLLHKSAWLNTTGYCLRLVAYFVIWIWLGRKVLARSRSSETQPGRRRRDIATSALYMAVFAVTFSLASVDWIQSLDPHWFSTIFALQTLAGLGCSGAAVCTIALVALRRSGHLRDFVTKDVLDDLGKILLALSLFWAYIWYCQYMIVWYTNLPEETGYYLLRREGGWATLGPVNLVVNFGAPFLALMLRSWRRNGIVLMRIAALILVGHALDLYVLIAPAILRDGPSLGPWELAPLVGALALFAWVFLRGLARAPLVAPGPPPGD